MNFKGNLYIEKKELEKLVWIEGLPLLFSCSILIQNFSFLCVVISEVYKFKN